MPAARHSLLSLPFTPLIRWKEITVVDVIVLLEPTFEFVTHFFARRTSLLRFVGISGLAVRFLEASPLSFAAWLFGCLVQTQRRNCLNSGVCRHSLQCRSILRTPSSLDNNLVMVGLIRVLIKVLLSLLGVTNLFLFPPFFSFVLLNSDFLLPHRTASRISCRTAVPATSSSNNPTASHVRLIRCGSRVH